MFHHSFYFDTKYWKIKRHSHFFIMVIPPPPHSNSLIHLIPTFSLIWVWVKVRKKMSENSTTKSHKHNQVHHINETQKNTQLYKWNKFAYNYVMFIRKTGRWVPIILDILYALIQFARGLLGGVLFQSIRFNSYPRHQVLCLSFRTGCPYWKRCEKWARL